MFEPNPRQCGFCFMAAVFQALLFGALASWADMSRERWPILILLTFGICAAVGGGAGASLGHMWIGVILGLLLPFAYVYAYGFPC